MKFFQAAMPILLAGSAPAWLLADTVYPSRLELKEVEPGIFEVRFNLPVINTMRLRAEPVLPELCMNLEEPRIQRTQVEYAEFRKVQCPTESLFGKAIAVQGLIGTQVDVVLFIELLDGRKYTATLRPANAAYEIPEPPRPLELLIRSTLVGARNALRRPGLAVLILALLALARRRREVAAAAVALWAGYVAGIPLAQHNWLQVSDTVSSIVLLGGGLLGSMALLRGRADPAIGLRPFWFYMLGAGLMIGGAAGTPAWSAELSRLEQNLVQAYGAIGFAGAVALVGWLVVELRTISRILFKVAWDRLEAKSVGYVAGTLSVAGLFYTLSVLASTSAVVPEAPAEFYVLALILGVWLGGLRPFPVAAMAFSLVVAVGLGVFLGQESIPLPLDSFFVPASLFAVGLAILAPRLGRPRTAIPLAILATLCLAWNASAEIRENLSFPLAVSTGAALTAALGLFLSRSFALLWNRDASSIALRAMGVGVILLALALRFLEYVGWFTGTLSGELALGFVRLPVLSLGLVIAAFFFWPRKRKVQELLNLEVRKTVMHWAFLVAAFFTIPFGTFRVKNIFSEPEAPKGDVARHILAGVLSNTYHAFNVKDEDELYDRLSQSVVGSLVADIYLDNRRKLTSGVRQGAKVDVREVNIRSMGTVGHGANALEGYTYDCSWSVTARVSHLQHVHYRQNVYSGEVTVVSDGEKWKISRIALRSEDRIIIPWGAG